MRYSSKVIRSVGPFGAAIFAAATLVACGSSDDGNGSDSSGDAGSSSGLVQTSDVSGVGTVLVDTSGRTLYFADEESDGTIKCVDACLSFWTPVEATGNLPSDIDGLGTMTRDDDGAKQVTYNGAPLYTFKLDKSPGDATGDDFSDSFGDVSFTWHAAATDASADDSGDDSGDGNDDGYDYGGGY